MASSPKYLSATATDEQVTAAAVEYIEWDTNEECRAAIRTMLQAADVASLRKALTSHLEFGTAGLRGPMGPGYCCMNELTVVQATQGLAAYLQLTQDKEGLATSGVYAAPGLKQCHGLTSSRCPAACNRIAPRCVRLRAVLVQGYWLGSSRRWQPQLGALRPACGRSAPAPWHHCVAYGQPRPHAARPVLCAATRL